MDSGCDPASIPRVRQHIWRGFRRIMVIALFAVIVAGLVGQVIRDRSVPFAVLMYLPLLPAGLVAIGFDLILRGRAIPGACYGLALLGLVASTWTVATMIGVGAATSPSSENHEISLLHWNVQWGGGLFRSQQTWAAQRSEILKRDADIMVLSELPPPDWLARLANDLGPNASTVSIEQDPGSDYWFRMVVCSRWPVRMEERISLPGGAGMSVIVEVRGRRLRLLCVDGQSNPFRSRLPFLAAIADLCRAATDAGRPFDVIAGDFNTPSLSLGFDALMDQGYTLASRSAVGWRGTFPSWLPLYDIDHVWLGPGQVARACLLYNGPATDHRGQVVRFKPSAVGERATDVRIDPKLIPGQSVPRQVSTLTRHALLNGRRGARRSEESASSRKSQESVE
jgi:endonuclease/exonuclease/phosphatase family metal-dependent hydrolase